MDIREGKIYETPTDTFSSDNRLYLGDYDIGQAVLCFRDGEFRIYTYDYRDDEDGDNDTGWLNLCYEFNNFSGSYRAGTLGYVVVEEGDEDELLERITTSCENCLDYFSGFAREEIPGFIKRWVGEMKKYTKVYTYYK